MARTIHSSRPLRPLRLGSLAALLSLASGPVLGADQHLGALIPEAGLVKKRVLSVRELRYKDMVPQQTDFSCGAAAVATILNYAYGRDLTETQVIEGMMKVADPELVREQGFSMLDMKHYVETLGMRARGYKVQPDTLDKIQVPTIALLDIRGYKHFVVLKKTVGKRVYVGDPALGNRVMGKDDFVAGWNGMVFAVIGKGFDRETVLLNPPEPLTVRRSHLVTSVPVSTLLEFGFTNADLF